MKWQRYKKAYLERIKLVHELPEIDRLLYFCEIKFM